MGASDKLYIPGVSGVRQAFYIGSMYKCPNCTQVLRVDVFHENDKSIFRFKCKACKWNGMMFATSFAIEAYPELVRRDIDKFLSIDVIERAERELELEEGYDIPFESCSD